MEFKADVFYLSFSCLWSGVDSWPVSYDIYCSCITKENFERNDIIDRFVRDEYLGDLLERSHSTLGINYI
ncbi:MAG: hypothetical protein ACI8ZB_003747 [Desulforhopalus sp.]|jgi:hypothetical protein